MFGNAKWRREQAVRGKRCNNGDMAEWLKALAWKASLSARATQVRILLSPPRTMAGQAKKMAIGEARWGIIRTCESIEDQLEAWPSG